MVINQKEKSYIVENYLDGIDFEDSTFFKEEAHKLYPESNYQAKERTRDMIGHLASKYRESDKKVAHVVVTHGYFVHQFSYELNGRERNAEYCSISGAEIHGDKASLILDCYSNHVLSASPY